MVVLRWMCVVFAAGMWQATMARADLIVDSFELAHSYDNPGGYGHTAPGNGLFGGARTIGMQVINSTQKLDINKAGSSRLDLATQIINVGNAFESKFSLSYNDPAPSIDLAAANAFAVSLADVQATAPWTLTVTFKGTNTATPAVRTISIPDATNNSVLIPFNTFDNSVLGLGFITDISLTFVSSTGAGPGISFGPVTLLTTTAVPEPCVLVLSALSLAGVCLRRRRSVK